MSEQLKALLEKARHYQMTPEELTRQEIGFAHGNAHYENARITIELVKRSLPASDEGPASDSTSM
jgi:hypothetical protein